MISSPPKLVIFDLDGTLIEFHHEYLFSQTEEILFQLKHPPVSRGELQSSFAAFDFFRFFCGEERDGFVESFWSMFDWENFPSPKLFCGAYETLEKLVEQEIKVAITTSRFVDAEELREELRETRILPFLSSLITRTNDHFHWTDKRGLIRETCELLAIAPEHTLMVGDIPPDIMSAKEVGVRTTVGVISGGIREDVLAEAGPDLILQGVGELMGWMFKAG